MAKISFDEALFTLGELQNTQAPIRLRVQISPPALAVPPAPSLLLDSMARVSRASRTHVTFSLIGRVESMTPGGYLQLELSNPVTAELSDRPGNIVAEGQPPTTCWLELATASGMWFRIRFEAGPKAPTQ